MLGMPCLQQFCRFCSLLYRKHANFKQPFYFKIITDTMTRRRGNIKQPKAHFLKHNPWYRKYMKLINTVTLQHRKKPFTLYTLACMSKKVFQENTPGAGTKDTEISQTSTMLENDLGSFFSVLKLGYQLNRGKKCAQKGIFVLPSRCYISQWLSIATSHNISFYILSGHIYKRRPISCTLLRLSAGGYNFHKCLSNLRPRGLQMTGRDPWCNEIISGKCHAKYADKRGECEMCLIRMKQSLLFRFCLWKPSFVEASILTHLLRIIHKIFLQLAWY